MGSSLDSHFQLTAGHIPTWLKGHFVVKDAALSAEGLLALVQPFQTCASLDGVESG